MKASEKFKTVIENYLTETAQSDTVFAQNFSKASKNLENCFNYIFAEVKKTGLCAFDNQEIFDMAVKYYADDSIGQPEPIKCRVVVSQPEKADLFSSASEVPQNNIVPKTQVPALKPAPKTLTLFDL
ncbi:PcfK-like family protein [Flavobacterium sp. LS1R47]|uniref:PcfK-like family protein n=1 Tax=Flavobacterium frigoritolerans TaxID=2987686 RepID=A0A9X2ZQL0_9FLAO|nr:PcfK-like family protein [Flavobacterium frigoritolerans]MCV9932852.1 PcfK-like family protein [Flavobacterium frigoritolerans]